MCLPAQIGLALEQGRGRLQGVEPLCTWQPRLHCTGHLPARSARVTPARWRLAAQRAAVAAAAAAAATLFRLWQTSTTATGPWRAAAAHVSVCVPAGAPTRGDRQDMRALDGVRRDVRVRGDDRLCHGGSPMCDMRQFAQRGWY